MTSPKILMAATHCDYEKDYTASVLNYIEEASDCEDKKDLFSTFSFNVNTGMMTLTTDHTEAPAISLPLKYIVKVDGVQEKDLVVEDNNLTFQKQITGLDTKGEIVGHTVELIVFAEDASLGCLFTYITSTIETTDYSITQGVDVYTLTMNKVLNSYTVFDINALDISWGINNGSVLIGETTNILSISTSTLFKLTGSSTLILYVKFDEVIIKTDQLGIPESEISIDLTLENILNETTFYTNILPTVVEGSNTVYLYLYLDYQLISDTHVLTTDNVGKIISAVLTLEENSVGNVFNPLATSTYFISAEQEITDYYELDMTFPINAFVNGSMVSSENDNRELLPISYTTDVSFSKTVGYSQPVSLASTYDSTYVIQAVGNAVGLDSSHIREGLIIDDIYFNEDTQMSEQGLRVYDSALELQKVNRGYLVNKKIEEENMFQTLYVGTPNDFTEFSFTGDVSNFTELSEGYIGFTTDDSMIISRTFGVNNIFNGIQVEMEYSNVPANIASFLLIKIYNTDNSLHSTYGYEKVSEMHMKSTDSNANVLVSIIPTGSLYINKDFTNIFDIGRIDIQISGGQSSGLTLRNLYIDVVTEAN